MTNILERKIIANYEPEHKPLYDWCLNELDSTDKKIGRDLIPWIWTLYFYAKTLKVFRLTSINKNYDSNHENDTLTKQNVIIAGTMQSGVCRDDNEITDCARYSMFGTQRVIDTFNFSISQTPDDEEERCTLYAIPSYEIEVDFRRSIEPDSLGFDVHLRKDKFLELVRLVENNLVQSINITVSSVSGFYSNWSPSISTNSIKILSSYHEILNNNSEKFQPKTVEEVGDFSINFISFRDLDLKPLNSIPPIPISTEQQLENPVKDLGKPEEIEKQLQTQHNEQLNNHILLSKKMISDLKIPLWCIFIVLVFLLLK